MIDALPLLLGPEGYQISRSVRLRSSASAFFNRTPGSATNQQKFTWSSWFKRGSLGALQFLMSAGTGGNDRFILSLRAADDMQITNLIGGVQALNIVTSQLFRDPSAWYHLVVAVDTTDATAANRCKVYLNGSQVTAFSTANYPAQNYNTYVNSANTHQIGKNIAASDGYFDGYLTEVNLIDGQALTPSSFGETDVLTGVWKPKKYAGTYGTNGFFLNFSDNSNNTAATIGKDYSGNGNNWTPNNISVTSGATYDSMLDVPTLWADGGNGRGNYCTLNPIDKGANITLANANLSGSHPSSTNGCVRSTIGMSSGKWYWEVTVDAIAPMIGIANASATLSDFPGVDANGWSYYGATAVKYNNASATSYGATYTAGDVIGVAFDADAGSLTFYKNGVSQGVAFSGLASNTYFAASGRGTNTAGVSFNFGQRPFAYTPPTGFKALNTQNLPEPTIKKGGSYFDVVLYTGDAVQDRAVTGFGFDLDLAWIKSRNNAGSHVLVNRVVGGDKQLFSNLTNAEQTNADVTNGFTTGGILLGDNVSGTGSTNQNTYTYALWGWKEGATQGFDIVTFTGTGANRTVAHSLGVAPRLVIVKRRDSTGDWIVWNSTIAAVNASNVLFLNSTDAQTVGANNFNSTAPTSSVFSVGTNPATNASGGTYVAYLFAEVAGFSRFGSYTGNGSADGPFVFCGFRPRWVMVKCSSAGENWYMLDSARNTYNPENDYLLANASNAEANYNSLFDFTSNGFKIRGLAGANNTSGATYIYAAFAESPTKYALAR